jgi:hypothetical protein
MLTHLLRFPTARQSLTLRFSNLDFCVLLISPISDTHLNHLMLLGLTEKYSDIQPKDTALSSSLGLMSEY